MRPCLHPLTYISRTLCHKMKKTDLIADYGHFLSTVLSHCLFNYQLVKFVVFNRRFYSFGLMNVLQLRQSALPLNQVHFIYFTIDANLFIDCQQSMITMQFLNMRADCRF